MSSTRQRVAPAGMCCAVDGRSIVWTSRPLPAMKRPLAGVLAALQHRLVRGNPCGLNAAQQFLSASCRRGPSQASGTRQL